MGTFKASLKFKAEFTYFNHIPYISIEFENSKCELHKTDIIRAAKVTKEVNFSKILEAKVDINLKIAKILANSMLWKVDFVALKGSKYTVSFPVDCEAVKHQDILAREIEKGNDGANLDHTGEYNTLHSFSLPSITTKATVPLSKSFNKKEVRDEVREEDSENENDDQDYVSKRKLRETMNGNQNYPLRQRSTCHAEILLLGLADLVQLFED